MMNTSMRLLSFKKHIHDAKVNQAQLSCQTRALLDAKMVIGRKVNACYQYRMQCEQDKKQLRAMALSKIVVQDTGSQRYFNYAEIAALAETLNTSSTLSWSIALFNGGVWIKTSFNRLIPALTFYVTASGKYKLSSFSLNINRGDNRVMVSNFY